MTAEDHQAWNMLCLEMADGLHQFDYWEDVPERVKMIYLARLSKENK